MYGWKMDFTCSEEDNQSLFLRNWPRELCNKKIGSIENGRQLSTAHSRVL